MTQSLEHGLYIVATPIGNLGDITLRAIEILRAVDAVACEDSRVTGKLLNHIEANVPMLRYNDHSSAKDRAALIEKAQHSAVALVSDAGTPMISDPGYKLVREAREAGVAIHTLPGASAAIAALTLAGLPTDRFLFAGFLPAKAQARLQALKELGAVPATLVLYESGPRLVAMLEAIHSLWPQREVSVVREISKRFEEARNSSGEELAAHYRETPAKGEIVLVIAPPVAEAVEMDDSVVADALAEALEDMPVSKAAGTVAKRFGLDRKALYQKALDIKADG
ncbi:MAG: 16S rRNA (cytidine(1402)-2'-O)-methyltransferase [Pseudomonadota bacterium]